jgi:LPXTG-motif cell wall-anchored protein
VTPPSTRAKVPPWAIGLGLGALAIGIALMLKKKKGR